MLQHPLAAAIMVALFTMGGLAAIRLLFPKNSHSPRPKTFASRLRRRTKLPIRF